jgi:hypothetical protein
MREVEVVVSGGGFEGTWWTDLVLASWLDVQKIQ